MHVWGSDSADMAERQLGRVGQRKRRHHATQLSVSFALDVRQSKGPIRPVWEGNEYL